MNHASKAVATPAAQPFPTAADSLVTPLELAQSLQSFTRYSDFIVAGVLDQDSTFFRDGVIFAYVVTDKGDHLAKVVKTSNPDIEVNDFIFISEIQQRSAKGETQYFPQISCGRSIDLENRRAEMLDILLAAVAEEGGHKAIVKAVHEGIEKDQARREAEGFAEKIRTDIASGKLESNPMMIFDDRKARVFGFVINGKPMVMQTGYEKKRYCLLVTDAPQGTSGGYEVGVKIQIGRLFDENLPREDVVQLAKAVIMLFSEVQLEEAKKLAAKFAPKQVLVEVLEKESADVLVHQTPDTVQ